MEDSKHRPFRYAWKGKPVFWAAEPKGSKWLQLVKSTARRLTPRERWRLRQQED